MKVTVIEFDDTEARTIKEGLKKLKSGVSEFQHDLRDNRIDAGTIEAFVAGLDLAANFFSKFLKEDSSQRTVNKNTTIDVP